MTALSPLEVVARFRREPRGPLPEALAAELGDGLLAFVEQEHAKQPPVLLRELFAQLDCMSIEQARGRPVDVRSDVFSAGLLLFELSCGRPAAQGLFELTTGELDAPKTANPALSDAFAAVIQRALATDPSQRFATASELRAALKTSCPGVGPEAALQWLHENGAPPGRGPDPVPDATPRTRRALAHVALGAALVLLTAAGGFVFWSAHQEQVSVEPSARPCDLTSDPRGAAIFLNGVWTGLTTPARVMLERNQKYVLELRAIGGSRSQVLLNHRRFSLAMASGLVQVEERYSDGEGARAREPATGTPADSQPAPPSASPGPPSEVDPEDDHRPAQDFETAPERFTLHPAHQVLVPDANCFTATGEFIRVDSMLRASTNPGRSQRSSPLMKGSAERQRLAMQQADMQQQREAAMMHSQLFELPVVLMEEVPGSAWAVHRIKAWETVAHADGATLCAYSLSENSHDRASAITLVDNRAGGVHRIAQPLVIIDSSQRVRVRSFREGRFRAQVSGDSKYPVVAFWEDSQGAKHVSPLTEEGGAELVNPKWVWFTVPVRERVPGLHLDVTLTRLSTRRSR